MIKRLLPLWLSAGIAAVALAGVADPDPKYSPKAEATASSLKKKIQAEIQRLNGHDWAGEYREGDGLGVNVALWIAPQAGYVFEWRGCLGLYDRNYGTVSNANGELHLGFTFPNKREGFQGIAGEFVPVKWGGRSYLIPADDLIGFCNSVNSQSEPRGGLLGHYLLRRGDEKLSVVGPPDVPLEYRAYLLNTPIRAEIVRVAPHTLKPASCGGNCKYTPVTVNAGRSSGLLPGMELQVTDPAHVFESVKIKSVGEHESEGVVTQIFEDRAGPQAGWKLSTLPEWRAKATR